MYAKTLLGDFQFLDEIKNTVWTLYKETRYDFKLKTEARIPTDQSDLKRVEELLGVFVFYEQFCLIIKEHPGSLVEQVRSRLLQYNWCESEGLGKMMADAFNCDGFINKMRIEWDRYAAFKNLDKNEKNTEKVGIIYTCDEQQILIYFFGLSRDTCCLLRFI